MRLTLPDEDQRWRCGRCGNLTRFDVVRSVRMKEFWHFDLAGSPTVETSDTLREVVEQVSCRWCGADDAGEIVARPDAGGPSGGPGE